ncbi:hypothetical protein LZI70_19925 (plasmid) [Vibrio pelagius]|uniref:Uncharacterized protein n=1 Tax=Vibrio pelagius TaxID=28169 RepID=A0ABY5GAQ8_VIBPE|nr:hypothetical protein [Vibrio pelagius]UTT87292.1 hypothetical protein LZI70_19925 [Vibrio pelagius]
MRIENNNESIDATHEQRIDKILFALKGHYQSCRDLVEYRAHQALSRAASRFLKIERSMINEIKLKISDLNPEIDSSARKYQPIVISNYDEMYQSNRQLITYLKNAIGTFNNPKLSSFFSYWVAALQVENDEMAKHL